MLLSIAVRKLKDKKKKHLTGTKSQILLWNLVFVSEWNLRFHVLKPIQDKTP